MNEWGDRGGAKEDLLTAEGAHLLFGLFLVAADLQVILQHSARRKKKRTRVIAAKTSCLLALGRIWEVVIGDSLWWTLLANGLITQQRQSWFMLGNEEVDSGWSTLRLKTYQMFSFRSSERKARLFFHLETFCLTTADLQPRIPWKQRGRARPGSDSQDCTWISLKSFGGVGEDSN